MLQEFKIKDGREAYHVYDGDEKWWIPSENPFGHGCCMCGTYHQVKYEIKDGKIELLFTKDNEETIRLQQHILHNPTLYPDNYVEKIIDLEAELNAIKEKYYSLIMAVSHKHPNETRHETAFRYILERESLFQTSSFKQDDTTTDNTQGN
jgi:hypothetical protein